MLGGAEIQAVLRGGPTGRIPCRDDGNGFVEGGVAAVAGRPEFLGDLGAVEGLADAELRDALADTLGLDEGGGTDGIAQQVHA
jgi:hypothetical protein